MYFYIKAIHIIFVVTWFAALFYMPRLFVYDIESRTKVEPERSILIRQLGLMQKRLWYGISWPSMILTLILGSWLVVESGINITKGWMLYKLIFVIALVAYHIVCHAIMNDLKNNIVKFSSTGMRIWNEIPTVILFAVVFLAVVKDGIAVWYGLAGLAALIVLLLLGIRIYKTFRKTN